MLPQKRMECFRLLLEHLAWIKHEFLSGIRDSTKAGSLWGMMKDVGGVRKSEHQSWLAKGLGLGLLCWGFKGVQEGIPWEETSTLQIGSVAFPPGQYTSPQLHCCHRFFDQDGQQVQRWLLRTELEFHVCTINKSAHTKKVRKHISWSTYIKKLVNTGPYKDMAESVRVKVITIMNKID